MARKTASGLKSWEYPKKSGIRIRWIQNATADDKFGVSFLVTVPGKLTGKSRQRKQFTERDAAQEWAKKMFLGCRKQGQDFFALTDEERREVAANLPYLRQHGISVAEAVRFAVKHLRSDGRTKTVRQVVKELVESKAQRFEGGSLRQRSYWDFRQRTGRFADAFEGRIASEVSGEEIKTWLQGLKVGSRTNKNYLSVVGELFKFATQKHYVAFSPLDYLTDVDRKELCGGGADPKEPSILTPAQAERLLTAALEHPELGQLGAVTLALFCGLRTEEIKRLEWAKVRLAESPPIVTIDAKIAKKRSVRNVEIPLNAILWLSLVADRTGQVTRSSYADDHPRRFRQLQRFAGFGKKNQKGVWHSTWENNAMRHSFGSYHFALHGNSLETSRLLGHKSSDQVLFDHYRALATKAQAEAYFAIRPPASAAKVVRFTGSEGSR
jgi:integrase